MDKRRIGIGIAVVAGLVILFFVGRYFVIQKEDNERRSSQAKIEKAAQLAKKKAKEAEEKATRLAAEKAIRTLHQVCQYADSIGIDTTRYAVVSTTKKPVTDAKLTQLLLEIRYGKKPSGLEYNGLKEKVDSAWARNIEIAVEPKALAGLSEFGPYNQLVGHYDRLKSKVASNPAIADSLRLIRQTLNFYRYVNRFNPDRFVVVNLPAGELNVFDRTGERLLPMQVIAGKPDRQTPCMTTYIQSIVTYPYWNVPRNIALEEMLPRMKRSSTYINYQNLQLLDDKNHEINPKSVDWKSISVTNFPFRVRQGAGCENSLGLLKFNLANPLAIYLHDTNSRDLFKNTKERWRSHGCVRVQKPVELANLVLGAETFDDKFLNECLLDQKPKTLPIPKRFPVFITYNIADVDAAGKLRFYKDVYSLDDK
ncbi:hypothetical protein BH09BAC4_BH09BAC4_46430 [soil metagenome]